MNLLTQLNPSQREAVTTTDGPVLVIAGAGSGKTKTLTHRVVYLIQEKKIAPHNILAVTFTNKASMEMKERIMKLLKESHQKLTGSPHIGTFHNICAKILRKEIDNLGYKKTFNIFDDQDQLALIKRIFKTLEINKDQFNPRGILSVISKAKNELKSAEMFEFSANGYYEEIAARVYKHYQKELKENNALDFDDLIFLTVTVFEKFPHILEYYQELFRYIMVDEYQDTNHAQYRLIKMLSAKHKNIWVCGDDWQCLHPKTNIQILPDKTKTISLLNKKDPVLTSAGKGSICKQNIIRNKKSRFNGELIKITTKSGHELLATPNHILFSKLSLNCNIFYVYLMYKKNKGYRIGMTRGARVTCGNIEVGLNVRANQERADKMWVLKICKTKNEAIYWEEYLSSYYGIPGLVFMTCGRNMKLPQKYLDKLYTGIDTLARSKKLFQDFQLNFDYPHHVPQSTIRNTIARISINFTLFNSNRNTKINSSGTHQISINSTDKKVKTILEKNGFKTRKGKLNDWRLIISETDYASLENILNQIKKILPETIVVKKASLTKDKKRFCFHPASHIRETMLVPIYKNGEIIEDEVIKIEKIAYQGPVYDLDINTTHNYIANGFVVHNSIYGWRQANIENILNFEKDYSNAKEIKLEQNYRSTQIILDAAAEIIAKNINQKNKKIWTEKKGGHLITSFEAADEKEEAQFIVQEIKNSLQSTVDSSQKKNKSTTQNCELLTKNQELASKNYSDFAILYRTNAQSRIIEEIMLKNSIPYRIIGGLKFYQRKEVKDIIAYLRLIQNPRDSISLERIINEPKRGLGKATLQKWLAFAQEKNINPIEAGLLLKNETFLNKGKSSAIISFCEFINKTTELKMELTLSRLIRKIFELSGYEKMLENLGEEGEVKTENIKELLSVSKKYKDDLATDSIDLFLEEVALVSDTDKIDQEQNSVHLMTLHSAKGLEFPVIFIAGLEEGILPHSRSMLSHKEMEEERRLMYVGVTRAKEKVYLLFTNLRTIFGSTQSNTPSRFLDDIPSHLMEVSEPAPESFFTSIFKEKTITKKPATKFKDGEKISHSEFGEGIVISTDNDILTVVFKKFGIKKLSATHALLKKI